MSNNVRAYDFGATESKTSDYTASARMLKTKNGLYIIEDYFHYRLNPAKVEKLIIDTAKHDGIKVKIILPIDPGAAGLAQKMYLSKALVGMNFEFIKETKSKGERFLPFSSQALAGNVRIIRNPFYNEFCDELEAFTMDPKTSGRHDDFVDCCSTCFNALLTSRATFRDIDTIKTPMWGNNSEDRWKDMK